MPFVTYPTLNQVIAMIDEDISIPDEAVVLYDKLTQKWKIVTRTEIYSIPPLDGFEIVNIFVDDNNKIVVEYEDNT